MRILAIGDPHGNLAKVKRIPIKNIDLILLTGDLGKSDRMRKLAFDRINRERRGLPPKEPTANQQRLAHMEAYTSSMRIVRYLSKYAPVMTIFGNVESNNAQTRKLSKEIGYNLPLLATDLKKHCRVINNTLARHQHVRIGGLQYFVDDNWVQEFKPTQYRKKLNQAKKATAKAKKIMRRFTDIDMLVCHQPPYGILDKVTSTLAPKHWRGKHAGSKAILAFIKKQQPKYVLCGHIHEGEGMKKVGKTTVYNLGVCGYRVIDV